MVSVFAVDRTESIFKQRIFSDGTAAGYQTSDFKEICEEQTGYFSFSGLPGTGKTLLLYDIAMKLSNRQQVCIIHCGEAGKKWEFYINVYMRIDFLSDNQLETQFSLEDYHAILVDEAHLLSVEKLNVLLNMSEDRPIIFQ